MTAIHAEEMLLFPFILQNNENVCEKCKVKPVVDKWNVCYDCLVESGTKATLTVTLCVDCFKSPVEWRNKKSYMERQLRAKGIPNAIVEMDYIHSGPCPICDIRRTRKNNCLLDVKEICSGNEEMHVDFDEYIEIKARRIVSELSYKRKKKLDAERYVAYESKMNAAIEKMVVSVETKQAAKNVANTKIQSILRKPSSFFLSKSDFEAVKDEI